jgi:hypothetical protein
MCGAVRPGTGRVGSIVAQPRGIPEDLAWLTKWVIARDADGHSHSWLNVEEIRALTEWYEEYDRLGRRRYLEQWLGTYFGNTFWDVGPGSTARGSYHTDVRFVFYFDN